MHIVAAKAASSDARMHAPEGDSNGVISNEHGPHPRLTNDSVVCSFSS